MNARRSQLVYIVLTELGAQQMLSRINSSCNASNSTNILYMHSSVSTEYQAGQRQGHHDDADASAASP